MRFQTIHTRVVFDLLPFSITTVLNIKIYVHQFQFCILEFNIKVNLSIINHKTRLLFSVLSICL